MSESSGPVPILRMTSAANGAPTAYTLMLVEAAGTLPDAVTGALKPDFDTESIVFVGMGEQAGEGYGATIDGVSRAGDELTVSAEFTRPDGEAEGAATTPWAAVVIPKQPGVSESPALQFPLSPLPRSPPRREPLHPATPCPEATSCSPRSWRRWGRPRPPRRSSPG